MSKLGILLNEQQKEKVANEVMRLYLFQDKHITDKQVVQVAAQIVSWGYPYEAIIQGLRLLNEVKLQRLQLGEIRRAIADSVRPRDSITAMNPADKGCCTEKIIGLKRQYGNDWWRHFE